MGIENLENLFKTHGSQASNFFIKTYHLNDLFDYLNRMNAISESEQQVMKPSSKHETFMSFNNILKKLKSALNDDKATYVSHIIDLLSDQRQWFNIKNIEKHIQDIKCQDFSNSKTVQDFFSNINETQNKLNKEFYQAEHSHFKNKKISIDNIDFYSNVSKLYLEMSIQYEGLVNFLRKETQENNFDIDTYKANYSILMQYLKSYVEQKDKINKIDGIIKDFSSSNVVYSQQLLSVLENERKTFFDCMQEYKLNAIQLIDALLIKSEKEE